MTTNFFAGRWIDINRRNAFEIILAFSIAVFMSMSVSARGVTVLEVCLSADNVSHADEPSLTLGVQGFAGTYGGAASDSVGALVQTGDGGYAIAGNTNSFGAGSYDFWLIKTDANGNIEWNKTYGGADYDYAEALVETTDGGYAIAGYTASFDNGTWGDFWLVKTDELGNAQWNRTYGGKINAYPNALVQTSDGGYAIAGGVVFSKVGGGGNYDFWLVKTDSMGNHLWNKTYGTLNDDGAAALVQTSDGGYAIAGLTCFSGAHIMDSWLIKTDGAGNAEWNRTYGGVNDDYATALVETTDGGYAIAGYTASFGAGDFWLVKTDELGNVAWNKTYGGNSDEVTYALVATSDGGYAMAGVTSSYGAGGSDFWLVKTDELGNAQWNKTYGGSSNEWAYALVATSDGGYALAGETWSYGLGAADCWLVKIDENGVIPEFPSAFMAFILLATVSLVTMFVKQKSV